MQLILFTDPHFDIYDKYPGKLDKDLDGLRDVYYYAYENSIKYVICAGDWFERDNRINGKVYSKVYSIIKAARKKGIITITIIGNHDINLRDDANSNPIVTFGDINKFRKEKINNGYMIIDDNFIAWDQCIIQIKDDIDSAWIALMPYYDDVEEFKNRLETLFNSKVRKTYDLLVGHFGLKESSIGFGSEFSLKGYDLSKFENICLGHIHKRETIKFGKKEVRFIGSLFQSSFKDEGYDTGFMVLDTRRGDIEYKEVENKKFLTLEAKTREEFNKIKTNYERGEYENYITRLKYGKNLSRTTSELSNEIDFESFDKEEYKFDYNTEMDLKSLIKKWIKDNYEGNLDRKSIIKIGKKLIKK